MSHKKYSISYDYFHEHSFIESFLDFCQVDLEMKEKGNGMLRQFHERSYFKVQIPVPQSLWVIMKLSKLPLTRQKDGRAKPASRGRV